MEATESQPDCGFGQSANFDLRGRLSLCVPKIDQALLNLSMSNRLELKPISVQVVNLSKQLSRLSGFRA